MNKEILLFGGVTDLQACAVVCRSWCLLVRDESLWKILFVRVFGVTPEFASALDILTAGKETEASMQPEPIGPDSKSCAICLEDMRRISGDSLILPCFHLFHRVCAVRWLTDHATCPLCKGPASIYQCNVISDYGDLATGSATSWRSRYQATSLRRRQRIVTLRVDVAVGR